MYLEINAVDKTELVVPRGLRYDGRVGENNLDVTISTRASEYMPRMGQDIKLYSSAGGTLIFGGVIKTLRKKKLEPLQASSAWVEVAISSDGYNSIPARRTVALNFTANETGNLISALRTLGLNNATFGNENVGLGNITSGITIEADYYSLECQSIKEGFDDLALMSGCKWYIGNDKALNFVSEDTVVTANHSISATDTETNLIHDITVVESLENYANKVFAVGGIGDDGNLIYATASDTSAITERASIEGTANSSGVYGFIIKSDTIDSMTAATTVADLHIKKYGYEPQEIVFSSYEVDWVAGTQVSVNLPEFGMTAAITCLIEEVIITSDANNIFKTNVRCARRESATFSTHAAGGGVQYFERILANNNGGTSSNLYGVPGSGLGGIQHYQNTTTATATITTSETTLTTKAFDLSRSSDIHMTFSAYLLVTAAVTVTAKTYLHEGTATTTTMTFQPQQNFSGNQTFAFNDFMEAVSAGTTTVTVKLVSDTGTVTVDTGKCAMNLLVFPRSLTPTFTAVISEMGYLFAGYDGSSSSKTSESYDPSSDAYTSKTDVPTARNNIAGFNISDKAYIGAGSSDDRWDEYDPSGDSWTQKADMSRQRNSYGATDISGKGYAMGGTGYNAYSAYTDNNEEYDATGDSWSNKTVLATARRNLTLITLETKGYAMGGAQSGSVSQANSEYDPGGDSWANKAVLTAKFSHGAFTISDKMYVCSGMDATSTRVKTGQVYDLDTDAWAGITANPDPARDHWTNGGAALSGNGYIFGGDTAAGKVQDNDEYDPGGDSWTNKTNITAPARVGIAVVAI